MTDAGDNNDKRRKAREQMKVVRALIDQLLNERRPDRYTVGGISEDGEPQNQWLSDIADEVAPLIPEVEAKKLFAQNMVAQREGQATRTANQLLRHLKRTGQMVMFWEDLAASPISVISVNPDDRSKKIEERVALRAARPDESIAFANEERRRAAGDFVARNDACDGALMAAEGAIARDLPRIWDYFATLGEPPDGDEDE